MFSSLEGMGYCGENFGFFKSPVMLCEYVFVFIPGVAHGLPQMVDSSRLWFVPCSGRGVILPAAESLLLEF